MESSYQKTARDTLIYGIATALTFFTPILQLPLLTKVLGASDYGLWSQSLTTVSLIAPLCSLGLTVAMMRFLAVEKNREKIQEGFYSVASVQFLVSLVIAVAIFLFAKPLADSFFDGAVNVVRITAGLIIAIMLEGLYLNLLRTFRQIKTHSIFLLADRYGCLAVIAFLVLNGYGLLSALLAYLVIRVVIILVLFFLIKSQFGIKAPNFSKIKEYLKFGLPTVPASIGFWLVNLSDRYVIGYFLGITPVGFYSASYGIGRFPYAISTVVNFILLVALSKLYGGGRVEEIKTHLRYAVKYFLAIVIPFIFGATILAAPVLKLFSTPEIATEGKFVMPLIALSFLFLGIHGIISNILYLTKKTKILGITWAVAATLNLGLNILVVPTLGILGAAITTLLSYASALIIVSYYSYKDLKFPTDWSFIIKSLFASVVMSLVIWFMAPEGNNHTILAVIVGVIVYGAIVVLLKGFSRNELQLLKSLMKRK